MSSFGTLLRLTTFGESHSKAVGGILEGFPSRFKLDLDAIQTQVNRRRARGDLSTARQEADQVVLLSGLQDQVTLGTPIAFLVNNNDIKPGDYQQCQGNGDEYIPRPSHADYTYLKKYGIHAKSGGGRSSARETIPRVIAGALAEQYLMQTTGCDIIAWVNQVGPYRCGDIDISTITRESIDCSEVKCPQPDISESIIKHIREAKMEGDSVGGSITCVIRNPPIGIGEPCFDKLEAVLAHAMMSIPATKSFEIGEGIRVAEMKGSENNDCFEKDESENVKPRSNRAGGVLGGISSGEYITMRISIKPPASISKVQKTCNLSGEAINFSTQGRHDPCVVQRAVSIVESMAAICIMDLCLIQKRIAIRALDSR